MKFTDNGVVTCWSQETTSGTILQTESPGPDPNPDQSNAAIPPEHRGDPSQNWENPRQSHTFVTKTNMTSSKQSVTAHIQGHVVPDPWRHYTFRDLSKSSSIEGNRVITNVDTKFELMTIVTMFDK